VPAQFKEIIINPDFVVAKQIPPDIRKRLLNGRQGLSIRWSRIFLLLGFFPRRPFPLFCRFFLARNIDSGKLRGFRFNPVALAFERVGGQRDAVPLLPE